MSEDKAKYIVGVGGRRNGKSLDAAVRLLEDIRQGRNSILIGYDYVVISRKQYDRLCASYHALKRIIDDLPTNRD